MEYLLNKAPKNKELTICKINETDPKLVRRFSELGFIIGQKIQILYTPNNRTWVICLRGFTLALDIIVCQKVVVHD